jgi:hypothetical protein
VAAGEVAVMAGGTFYGSVPRNSSVGGDEETRAPQRLLFKCLGGTLLFSALTAIMLEVTPVPISIVTAVVPVGPIAVVFSAMGERRYLKCVARPFGRGDQ